MITGADTGRAGLSLVEVLVALAITGLMTGAVYLTMRPAHDPARVAAEQMQLDLARAETLAVTRGRFIGLRTHARGYDFLIYEAGTWVPMERRSALAARVLPDSVTLLASFPPVSDREGQAVVPDYWFDPTGANDAARFTLQSGESRWQVSAGGRDGTLLSGGAS